MGPACGGRRPGANALATNGRAGESDGAPAVSAYVALGDFFLRQSAGPNA
jgi:hypothetical protein